MSAVERFRSMTQDIPRGNPNSSVMAAAKENVRKKRQESLQAKAEALYEEAFKFEEELNKLKNEFEGKLKGKEKEFNKLLNRIQAFEGGQPPPPENDQETPQESQS